MTVSFGNAKPCAAQSQAKDVGNWYDSGIQSVVGRGKIRSFPPIQFGYRLWPPQTKKYTWDVGKHIKLVPLAECMEPRMICTVPECLGV